MKKDLKYYIILLLAVLVFILYEFNKPKAINWNVSLSAKDKNPFGTFVLNDILPDLFKNGEISFETRTFYQINEEDSSVVNYFVLSENFSPDEEDIDRLFDMVEAGSHIFIASGWYDGKITDSLNINLNDVYFDDSIRYNRSFALTNGEDSMAVNFVNPYLGDKPYYFKTRTIAEYFSSIDTARTEIIAVNGLGHPVMISTAWGQGRIILSTLPMAFTNYYMVCNKNHEFISRSLSYLPDNNLVWNTYYQFGSQEPLSPLRFIFGNEALRGAYYIGLSALLIFVLFEVKRRQRIIPVVAPPKNATLEFTQTVGSLYYNHADHQNLAVKKITYFKEQLRAKYFIQTNLIDDDFYHELSNKTDKDLNEVRNLFKLIRAVESGSGISENELFELSQKLDEFLKN